MLAKLNTCAVIPAADLARARAFYKEKLGLDPASELPGRLVYKTGAGSTFIMYETGNAGTAKNTAMGWETNNLDADMDDLRSRGVVFEEYDMPGLKTVNGVADAGGARSAWFKDSEGNILALSQSGS